MEIGLLSRATHTHARLHRQN